MVVANSPSDGISSLSFSPTANILVAGCWDSKLYCWEIAQNGQSVAKAMATFQAPVLDTSFYGDGTKAFAGTCDNKAMMFDLASQQSTQVGVHDAPVKSCHWIPDVNLLVTGGWDKKLRYWDLRQQTPALDVNLPERLYCMDVVGRQGSSPVLVAGCAGRHMCVYDLKAPSKENRRIQSGLSNQTRCVSMFPNGGGFAIGSIEGRCYIQSLTTNDKKVHTTKPLNNYHHQHLHSSHSSLPSTHLGLSLSLTHILFLSLYVMLYRCDFVFMCMYVCMEQQNFSFKCHRTGPENNKNVFAVNSVNFLKGNPNSNVLVTAGLSRVSLSVCVFSHIHTVSRYLCVFTAIVCLCLSYDSYVHICIHTGADGSYAFWDKAAKKKLAASDTMNQTISATAFNANSSILAYALSYDWSMGAQHYDRSKPNAIYLHAKKADIN